MSNSWVHVETPDLPDTFWAYMAAFIDGEGAVTMCQNGPRLILSNTDLPVLEWFKAKLKCGYIQTLKKQPNTTKPCYNLNFGSNAIRAVLPKTIPFMHIKQRRAELLMEYLNGVRDPKDKYHTDMREERSRIKQLMAEA